MSFGLVLNLSYKPHYINTPLYFSVSVYRQIGEAEDEQSHLVTEAVLFPCDMSLIHHQA